MLLLLLLLFFVAAAVVVDVAAVATVDVAAVATVVVAVVAAVVVAVVAIVAAAAAYSGPSFFPEQPLNLKKDSQKAGRGPKNNPLLPIALKVRFAKKMTEFPETITGKETL